MAPSPSAARTSAMAERLRAQFASDDITAEAMLGAVRQGFGWSHAHWSNFMALLDKKALPRPACAKGCAACCYTVVSALPPEIFTIARAVDALPPGEAAALKRRVIAYDTQHRGTPGSARMKQRAACPLLDAKGLCALHAVRPFSCRGVNGLDTAACARALSNVGERQPAYLALGAFTTSLYQAFCTVLSERGLAHEPVELTAGLALVFQDASAETRWLAGEDVFCALHAAPLAAKDRPAARPGKPARTLLAAAPGAANNQLASQPPSTGSVAP